MSIDSVVSGINWASAFDSMIIWILVFVGIIVFGLIIYFIYNWTTYNVQVEIIRQVGESFVVEENGVKTKKINYKSEFYPGKIYQKKLKSGGYKEYFKISRTNWDYLNYFQDSDFNQRKPGLIDFKKIGIKLFMDQQKGLIPLRLSNPGFEYSKVSLNEVIGAISDSLHEREQLYNNGFWEKYGAMITIASLMAFFVIGMVFLIKYQDAFWKNSMSALQTTIEAVKSVNAPVLK